MKSSSIFIIVIGAVLGYLGYKYYYLPTTKSATVSTSATTSKAVSSSTAPTTTSKAVQSGTATLSQAISSGLISSSKVATLSTSNLRTLEEGLGSPITTAIQKNNVSNALITTAGLTTNTVQGEAYGAKLSNASRLVKVMNTSIPSKTSSSTSKTSSSTSIHQGISSVFKQIAPSSIVYPITTTKSIVEPKQNISTSQVHTSTPQTIALNRIQSVMKNRSMMRF